MSVYYLHGRPDPEVFSAVHLTTTPKVDTLALQQRLADIQRQIGGLNIVEVLANIESRVGQVEKRLSDLESHAKKS